MQITISSRPESKYKLIPVASEQIKGDSAVTTIRQDGKVYKVIDRITYHKGEFIPTGFMRVVMGKELTMDDIWDWYKNSDSIIIFVGEDITTAEIATLV